MGSPTAAADQNLDSILREDRVFPPPPEFAAKAHVGSLDDYEALYARSIADPEGLLGQVPRRNCIGLRLDQGAGRNLPWAKWFVGGKINLCYNCVDRHALSVKRQGCDPLGRRARRSTQAQLWRAAGRGAEVRQCPQGARREEGRPRRHLYGNDSRAGDRTSRLRAHRRGHSVIFGGFAANALVDRINDAQCTAILTQDGSYRRGSEVKLKPIVDEALVNCPSIKMSSYTSAPARRRHESGPRPLVA